MAFREINAKMVEATVVPGQRLFSQRGAMLAYRGEVSFTPNVQGGQGGVMSMIGRRVAGEATPLMTVEGSGTVLFGHGGHHVHVIEPAGDTLYVEADRLLAFEGTLRQGTMPPHPPGSRACGGWPRRAPAGWRDGARTCCRSWSRWPPRICGIRSAAPVRSWTCARPPR